MEKDSLLPSDSLENKSKYRMITFIIITIILLALSITFIALYITEKNKDPQIKEPGDGGENETDIPLQLWNDTNTKKEILDFIELINSKEHYVPKEDRIAVFDLDGTLFQETDPVYNDWKLFCHRVLNDSTYNASDDERIIGEEILTVAINNSLPEDLNIRIAESYGDIFKDLTLEEYAKYIKDFVDKPAEGYENLKRGDAFYKPMIELIEYLKKNDFNVYISSGTDRYQVRTVIEGHINIPKSNVIGSDYKIKATKQGNKKANEYEYDLKDKFNFDGEFLAKNLKTNKVIGIIREIGKQPILAFGNSGGDSCMANYTINNNKYPSKAFMVCCDDLVRENGNEAKATSMYNNCEKSGWIPISMKNDWKTIYGENVERKKGNQTYPSF